LVAAHDVQFDSRLESTEGNHHIFPCSETETDISFTLENYQTISCIQNSKRKLKFSTRN
jgi:hypothetical protein